MYSLFNREHSKSSASNRVFPYLKNIAWQRQWAAPVAASRSSQPVTELLAGDLVLGYTTQWGEHQLIDHAMLEKIRLPRPQLKKLAKINAMAAIGKLRIRPDGLVHQVTAENTMAACTFLFPHLWEQTEKTAGGAIIAAFPHRNMVLYARADIPDAVSALTCAMEQACGAASEVLSRTLYRRVDGEWSALVP